MVMAARAAAWHGHPAAAPPDGAEFDLVAGVLVDAPYAAAMWALGERRGDAHPPTPGQLAAAATEPAKPPCWEEAWPLIQRACSRHGANDPDAGLASLPQPMAAWAAPRWRDLCLAPVGSPDGGFILGRWAREWREFRDDPAETRRLLAAFDRRRLGDGPGFAEIRAEAEARIARGALS